MTGGPGAGATIGIIANSSAGSDVRRLTTAAAQGTQAAKVAAIRQVGLGAAAVGPVSFIGLRDPSGLCERALVPVGLSVVLMDARSGDGSDSTMAASHLRDAGCGAVIVLGGDGTAADVARGWDAAPMIALSNGTNNVFPRPLAPTAAGMAASLVATGLVDLDTVSTRAKVIRFLGGPAAGDMALVDAAVVDGRVTGSRAVTDAAAIHEVLLCCAEPGSVGLSAIGALLDPCLRSEPGGIHVRVGRGTPRFTVSVPLGPGHVVDVPVAEVRRIAFGEEVELDVRHRVLATDGERRHVFGRSGRCRAAIVPEGPRVIQVEAVLQQAAERGLLRQPAARPTTTRGAPDAG